MDLHPKLTTLPSLSDFSTRSVDLFMGGANILNRRHSEGNVPSIDKALPVTPFRVYEANCLIFSAVWGSCDR